jgi:hypothetical protein
MSIKAMLRTSLLSLALGLPAGWAFAQAGQADCTPGAPSSRTAPSTAEGAKPGGTQGSDMLTEKLDDCNGVLTPPPVGDGDIVEPAPQAGKMPVITPNDLPKDGNPPAQP